MILITGGAGYVGSHVAHSLIERGHACVALDNLSSGCAALLPPGAPLEIGDCGDRAFVEHVMASYQVTGVIHCAGSISVVESMTDPVKYYRNNVANALSVLEAALERNVQRFLFSSTATVYGAPDLAAVSEDAPVNPVNPYAASKAMVERVLVDVARATALQVAILRYFNVAGADPQLRTGQLSREATHLVKRAAMAALQPGTPMTVTGTDYPTADGTGVRDYIHVSDLADAHVLTLEQLDRANSPLLLNIGYGKGASVLEVLDALDRVCGAKIPRSMVARRPGDVASLVADASRARSLLGWTPRFDDLDVIVLHALEWERKIASTKSHYVIGSPSRLQGAGPAETFQGRIAAGQTAPDRNG